MSRKDIKRRKLNKRKVFFFSVILFLGVVASIAGMLEAFARYIVYVRGKYLEDIDPEYFSELNNKDQSYQFKKPFYLYDEKCGWINTPNNEGTFRGFHYPRAEFRNRIVTNSSGFRSSSEYKYEPDKLRIAMLGDSFLQALQVKEEEILSTVIERTLSQKGLATKVYNFGVSSTGTIHQYGLFFEKALKIKPNIVIILFFSNDLIDNSPYYEHESLKLIPDYTIEDDGRVIVNDFGEKPGQYLIKYTFSPPEKRGILERGIKKLDNFTKSHRAFLFLRFLVELFRNELLPIYDYDPTFDIYKKKYIKPLRESFYVTVKLLEQLNDYCKNEAIEFIVVLIPSREQVNKKEWDRYVYLRRNILIESAFDANTPLDKIKKVLQHKGIKVVDLRTNFIRLSRTESLYCHYDRHFNQKGQQRAGEIISEFLLNKILN